MAAMTLKLPKIRQARLRRMACARGVSVNKLLDEFSVNGLARYEAEVRFRALVCRPQSSVTSSGERQRVERAGGPLAGARSYTSRKLLVAPLAGRGTPASVLGLLDKADAAFGRKR